MLNRSNDLRDATGNGLTAHQILDVKCTNGYSGVIREEGIRMGWIVMKR